MSGTSSPFATLTRDPGALARSVARKRVRPLAKSIARNSYVPLLRGGLFPVERCRVGTFHKSGTVLWYGILHELFWTTGLRVWDSERTLEPAVWDVEFNHHSEFSARPPGTPPLKTLITVRDPRDIVISAAKYHLWAKEAWLDNPDLALDGYWRDIAPTYRAAIASFETDRERRVFEMDHVAGRAIRRMLASLSDSPTVKHVKLEDLMQDTGLEIFQACFEHLGFNPRLTRLAKYHARRNSIFSAGARNRAHVQSGRVEQWREIYDDELRAAFEERFPDAVARLGYPAF